MGNYVYVTKDASTDTGHQSMFVNMDRVDYVSTFTANEGKWYFRLHSSNSAINLSTVNKEFDSVEEAIAALDDLVDVVKLQSGLAEEFLT